MGKEKTKQSEFPRLAQITDARTKVSSVEMNFLGFPFSCSVCQETFETKYKCYDRK